MPGRAEESLCNRVQLRNLSRPDLVEPHQDDNMFCELTKIVRFIILIVYVMIKTTRQSCESFALTWWFKRGEK